MKNAISNNHQAHCLCFLKYLDVNELLDLEKDLYWNDESKLHYLPSVFQSIKINQFSKVTIASLSDASSTYFEIDDSYRYEIENAAKVFITKQEKVKVEN